MTPSCPYLRAAATRSGVSARHGGHHVAKKFTTTTWPRKLDRLSGRPSVVASEKSGAATPTAGAAALAGPATAKLAAAKRVMASAFGFMGTRFFECLRSPRFGRQVAFQKRKW